jgi:hypothetical protein
MNQLKRAAKLLLPRRIHRFIRARYHELGPKDREFVFRRAMRRFLKNPRAHAHVGSPVLKDLIHCWGNDWSALDEYLVASINHAMAARGPILECGSGLSTLLVGAVAKMRGQRHFALEHTPAWAAKVQSYLNLYNLDTVVLPSKPLRDYGEYSWYDISGETIPDSFSLVICDGPPATTNGGRYGLVPVMWERLKSGCVVLLDDAGREQERAVARRWQTEFGASFRILGTAKPYIEMTVAGFRSGVGHHAPPPAQTAVETTNYH